MGNYISDNGYAIPCPGFGTFKTPDGDVCVDAVREAIMTCYAVEGAYPESVEYLQENYRLAYDEERYLVNIESFAANRSPDVYVVERGAAE